MHNCPAGVMHYALCVIMAATAGDTQNLQSKYSKKLKLFHISESGFKICKAKGAQKSSSEVFPTSI